MGVIKITSTNNGASLRVAGHGFDGDKCIDARKIIMDLFKDVRDDERTTVEAPPRLVVKQET